MSTVPGQESVEDAGLVEPDPALPAQASGEDYEPTAARPDLRDEAAEADVAEQEVEVPPDESEEYPED